LSTAREGRYELTTVPEREQDLEIGRVVEEKGVGKRQRFQEEFFLFLNPSDPGRWGERLAFVLCCGCGTEIPLARPVLPLVVSSVYANDVYAIGDSEV
jgi:hypothetical protein